MNQQERDDLRAHWDSGQQHRTHFLDCYKWHPECAVIRVLDAWEAEKAKENESAPKYYRWDDVKQLNKEIDCDHTGDNGLCWCGCGLLRCFKCGEKL